MLEVLAVSLNKTALVGFVVYLIGAVLLFMLFQFVYTRITPHKEFELIRSGNIAAAIALSGAIIGFAIPASNVIAFSVNVLDFVLWAGDCGGGAIAGIPRHRPGSQRHLQRIANGEIASGIYVAAVAISVGMLNAACMTPSN
jgi:putative membrane protein